MMKSEFLNSLNLSTFRLVEKENTVIAINNKDEL